MAIRPTLKSFAPAVTSSRTTAVQRYLTFYQLDLARVRHTMGIFQSGEFELVAQLFCPPAPKGTLLFLHGYFDHCGVWRHFVRYFTDKGFAVAGFDLPGHGLSSGARLAITDFQQYAAAIDAFFKHEDGRLPRPLHVVGHSTGCAAFFEYLRTFPQNGYERVVFLAPLVRSAYWHLSRFGYFVTKPFVTQLPRQFRAGSSDPAFIAALKRDPLQDHRFPTQWIDALHAWNERIQAYPVSQTPLTIIQGTADDIVAWRYNLEFLRRKLPACRVVPVDGGRHQLMNETFALRRQTFEFIMKSIGYE